MPKKLVKKVRRTRSSNKPKRQMYFNTDTQEAISKFCQTDDFNDREFLYVNYIKPALEKLAENLIYIYGFHKQAVSVDQLKNDCVVFLYESLHKFDHSRGKKAFSYFNVVAKNWLIINSRRTKKRRDKHVSIDNRESLSSVDLKAIASHSIAPSPQQLMEFEESRQAISDVLIKIKARVSNTNEVSCIDAIIKIFEMVDQLDYLNKRAVFVYVRDISGLSPKQLSISMSIIRKHYKDLVGPDKEFQLF